MNLSPKEIEVLTEFRLVEPDGSLVQVDLLRPEDEPLGKGPKMDEESIRHLVDADSTPDKAWLRWIFFQAGGGQRGKDATVRAHEQIKERFFDERKNGWQDTYTKAYCQPISDGEAQERWAAVQPKWENLLEAADQDIVDHLGVFGYYRAWPGNVQIYKRTATVVEQFQRLHAKIEEMNAELESQGSDKVSMSPASYDSLATLEKCVSRVKRYFSSKEAREDIQVDPILDNEVIKVLCPLTYAASVRYGFDNWTFANRNTFEEVLTSDNSFRDAWKQMTQRNVLVYIYWKVPVPSWISRKGDQFHRYELTNLALQIPKSRLCAGPISDEKAVFHNEESATTLSAEQLIQMLTEEVERKLDQQDDEMPIKRGPNAYSTQEELQLRLDTLQEALKAIDSWAKTFDVNRIKSDVCDSLDPSL